MGNGWPAALERIAALHPRTVIPFIGSGFSLDLGYPGWPNLLMGLADVVEQYSPHLAAAMRERIGKKQYLAAASLAYQMEVPASARVKFFKGIFETTPALSRRHRLLGSLPVGAFLTTNFDANIERAIAENGRHHTVYSGRDRFSRFNSNYPLYLETFSASVQKAASVVKIHNDTSDCENIVLSTESFQRLLTLPGFTAFYQNTLRNNHLLFIGFSGDDPNLVGAVLNDIKHYSGYGIEQSFLLLEEGTVAPPDLEGTPVSAVFYPAGDNHRALTELLKTVGDAWKARILSDSETLKKTKELLRGTGLPGDQPPLDIPFSGSPTIFEVMIPAVKTSFDSRIIEVVSENMVREAIEIAKPHADDKSIADRLAHRYRVGIDKAAALVKRHKGTIRARTGDEVNPITPLNKGVRARCLSFDPNFNVTDGRLETVVRTSIELALESYGCALALALTKGDRPSRSDLSHIVRTLLEKQSWAGVGDADKDAILLAIPDLFLRPSPEEAGVINRLAVTATAFGLIQGLPRLEMVDELIPSAIYLDTTCVLPLITRTEPRFSGFYALVTLAKNSGIPVRFLDTFLSEVTSHYKSALATIRQHEIGTVSRLIAEVGQSLEDHSNVFLLMICRGDYDADSSPAELLQDIWKKGKESTFRSAIIGTGIDITSPRGVGSDALVHDIVVGKKNWYERTLGVRTKLAKNEAVQVAELQSIAADGQSAWFATADAQLRRILRRRDVPAGEYVLPVAGIIGLLNALGTGTDLSQAYPRVLWTPNIRDDIDQVLGDSIRNMIDQCGENMRPPIEEARKLAVKEYLRRSAESKQTDDLEIDTAPDTEAQVIRESVYFGIGRAIEEEKGRGR